MRRYRSVRALPAIRNRPGRGYQGAAAAALASVLPLLAAIALLAATPALGAQFRAGAAASVQQRLMAAYPDHIARIEGDTLYWRDGSRSIFDDGTGAKTFEAWLTAPDVEDMLAQPYSAGPVATPPAPNEDPGRARNRAFFDKIYGDCTKGEVIANLVDVDWLPRKSGGRIKATRINGVAARLAAVSRELDRLPRRFDRYLLPPAGTYVCRTIAGTQRQSAHGYGIAIDIASATSDYWRWSVSKDGAAPRWRNRIPYEIVEIFERHGFIWGGKWHHYDTMHFEFRPELIQPASPPAGLYP